MPRKNQTSATEWLRTILALGLILPTPYVATVVNPIVLGLYLVPVSQVLGHIFGFEPKPSLSSLRVLLATVRTDQNSSSVSVPATNAKSEQ